jgi:hypothetical protein
LGFAFLSKSQLYNREYKKEVQRAKTWMETGTVCELNVYNELLKAF